MKRKFQRLNVETIQDKEVCRAGDVAVGNLQTKGNKCLRQKWKQKKKKKRGFWAFRGNNPKDETTVLISQEIVSYARMYSEEYSGKALLTKAGIFWWQLLWCLEEVKQRLLPGNTRDCIQRSLRNVHKHKFDSILEINQCLLAKK